MLDAAARHAEGLVRTSVRSSDRLRVETVKPPERKSAVFRIVDENGRAWIVKRCDAETGRIEATVYREVLSHLDLPAPTLHAYAEDAGDAWLVLDDVGGRPFDASWASDRVLAARWMADLHVASHPYADTVALPARGSDAFAALLVEAGRTVDAARANPAWPESELATLDGLARAFALVEVHRTDVVELARHVPTALVHGGIAGKNVHVRSTGSRSELLAFDWEAAGWGPPLADLSRVEPAAYLARLPAGVRRAWPDPGRAFALGTIWWCTAPIPGERRSVVTRHVARVAAKLAYYREQIERALAGLGWRSEVRG